MVRRAFVGRPAVGHFPEERFGACAGGVAFEDGNLADAIGLIACGEFGSGDLAEGGEEIDSGDEGGFVELSYGGFSGPACDEGDVDAAFEESAFVALATGGDAFGSGDAPSGSGGGVVGELKLGFACGAGGSVVRGKNDEGVFGELESVEGVEDFTNTVVGVGENGGVDLIFAAFHLTEAPLFGIAGNPGEVAVDVVASGEMSGHDGSAAGRADSAGDGEAGKVGAFPGEAVF